MVSERLSLQRLAVLALLLCACSSGPMEVPLDAPAPTPTDAGSSDAAASDASSPDAPPAPVDPGLPPDPVTVAPPLDRSVATSVFAATSFLYTGDHPIQRGVDPATIEAQRVAVLRGRVTGRNASPVTGATVVVLGHPELGETLTRADGAYDLATNGGSALTVVVRKDGFLQAQRTVDVPWQDYVPVPEIVLVQPDPLATSIDLSADGMKIARGSAVTDASGTRRATLLFPPGTQATVTTDSETLQLSTLTVHLTEFTTGSDGPRAMPGSLPPTSAYTYAVEVTVDEAGGRSVELSQPALLYVDNFIGFAPGTGIPVGAYDRDEGKWTGLRNGVVLKVIAIANGLAEIDSDGDGVADDATALTSLGVTDLERQTLATVYAPGDVLWRSRIPHFSSIDCNAALRMPQDARFPGLRDPREPGGDPVDDGCEASGSIIQCHNQTLGEDIPISGTPYFLHYQSDRQAGRRSAYSVDVALSDAAIPASVTSIILEVQVAGRVVRQSFPPAPNQHTIFTWDGLDAYGRMTQGRQAATISVGHMYRPTYADPTTSGFEFAQFPGARIERELSPISAREEVTIFQRWKTQLGASDALPLGLGGFTINVQHAYDLIGKTLYAGDGDSRRSTTLGQTVLQRIAITPAAPPGPTGQFLSNVSMRSDGGFYQADSVHRVVYDNTARIVAGILTPDTIPPIPCSVSGDGGPADQANLCFPSWVATAPDGSFYIIDTGQIRRVTPDGIIHTIAGKRDSLACPTAPGPALEARLCLPQSLVVTRDGTMYFADSSSRIFRIGVDGFLSVIAGTGTTGFSGDGGPASQAMLSSRLGLAVDHDGSIVVADGENHRIRRITTDGVITTIAGTGAAGDTGDGGPATNATFQFLLTVAIGPDGSLYISDAVSNRYRVVSSRGIISTFAGNSIRDFSIPPDGHAPTDVSFLSAAELMVGADGAVYLQDILHSLIMFRVAPALPSFTAAEHVIPSQSGSEVYVFDSDGRHLRTIDATTGVILIRFEYDRLGRLSSVADVDGKVTQIERNAAGDPTAIVAPFGQRTSLALDRDGYLRTITDPAAGTHVFAYGADGLLSTYTDPLQGVHEFTYDDFGRLISDADPGQGTKTLSRTGDADDSTVTLATALGRTTSYRIEHLPTGEEIWSNALADGTQVRVQRKPDGSVTSSYPDGTTATQRLGPDPRFGLLAPVPISLTLRTPGGLVQTQTTSRSAQLLGADPTSLVEASETFKLNGKAFLRSYSASAKQITVTSPLGRSTTATLDDKGRIVNIVGTSPTALQLVYDALGRPASVAHGARQRSLTYGTDGYVDASSDALARTVRYDRDPLGRITRSHWPDSGVSEYGFDPIGDITRVAPPGQPDHRFERDISGQIRTYVAPDVGASTSRTTYDYNLDHQLTKFTAPDGASIAIEYDPAGRPSHFRLPEGQIDTTYDASGRLSALAAPGGTGLVFAYDGSLPTDTTWTGPVAGAVHVAFDNDFRVKSERVNDGPAVVATYDDDGLATGVGALTITRDGPTGRINQTRVGSVMETYTFNGFGELAGTAVTCSDTTLGTATLTRDAAGTITGRSETLLGDTHDISYDHDALGQLTGVHDGARTATYDYDPNGNRRSAARPDLVLDLYDAQDRLVQHGSTAYTYTASGHLRTKTDGLATTTYTYDLLGNLRSALLPSGQRLTYVIDGLNRRIGTSVDGALTQGFLYNGAINIVAELDAAGAVVSRFVYGARANVPDYMVKAGATYRIVSDHVGSPRLVVDVATCQVVQRIDYDEFGRVLSDSNPGFQPFGFASGLHDRDTGLVHFGARDYDPETGRWTAKDPAGFAGGDSNLYAYAGNNPINFIDPTGLSFMQGLTNFAAGFGDTITFGGTRWVRKKLDVDSVVNPCSGWYTVGGVAGIATATVATMGVGAEAGIAADAIGGGTERLAATLTDSTFFHYTDTVGYQGIIESGAIRANASNQVFLTQEMVSASEASDILFAGNPGFAAKGSHMLAIDAAGLALRSGVQPNELVHLGTIRLVGRLLFSGPNPF